MNLLEIAMLIIGIIIFIISCRLVSRTSNEGDKMDNSNVQDDFAKVKEEQKEDLTAISEEVVTSTEDYLSKLSNEKIMAVSEFSDQILEKINHNHEEVVFLYNMLGHKEKELKEIIREFDLVERKTKEFLNNSNKAPVTEQPRRVNMQAQAVDADSIILEDKSTISQPVSINNAEILKLYAEGKSILDISRQLGIGQGEIKLIIDLYKDK
ncbi:MAG: helix-turn-helix domain-containing protein [Clostridiales bacterium]|nr:helix-turn-helix domain-containing protein [Clostridiales bacterium]